jgi:hypothetical protein
VARSTASRSFDCRPQVLERRVWKAPAWIMHTRVADRRCTDGEVWRCRRCTQVLERRVWRAPAWIMHTRVADRRCTDGEVRGVNGACSAGGGRLTRAARRTVGRGGLDGSAGSFDCRLLDYRRLVGL